MEVIKDQEVEDGPGIKIDDVLTEDGEVEITPIRYAISSIGADYTIDGLVRMHSDVYVSNYVQAKLTGFQNPKMGLIMDLFKSFNAEWGESPEQATKETLADSVNSIVGNRNKIAHGQSVSLGCVYFSTTSNAKRINGLAHIDGLWQ